MNSDLLVEKLYHMQVMELDTWKTLYYGWHVSDPMYYPWTWRLREYESGTTLFYMLRTTRLAENGITVFIIFMT